MYIGKYSSIPSLQKLYPHFRSYAGSTNCNCSGGTCTWTGIIATNNGINQYDSGTGSTCDQARAEFCKKWASTRGIGKGGTCDSPAIDDTGQMTSIGRIYNDLVKQNTAPGAPKPVDDGQTVHPFDTPKDAGLVGAGVNQVSGCKNCADPWDPFCQVAKYGCEAQNVIKTTINNVFGNKVPWQWVVFGAAGLVIAVIIHRRL